MVFCLLGSQVSMGPVSPQHLTLFPRAFRAVPQGGIRAQDHVVLLFPPAEPAFVGAYAIPDTYNPHDDKVYIFFRETAMEAGQWEWRHVHARVARVCKVSCQGQHLLASCPHQVGLYLLWTKEHPKQRNVGVSLHTYHRAEGSGLGVSLCGSEEGTAVERTQRGWTDPGSWCLAERCWG